MKSVIILFAIATVASSATQPQKFIFQQNRAGAGIQALPSTRSAFAARPTYSQGPVSPVRTAFPQYASGGSSGQYSLENSGTYNPQPLGYDQSSNEGQYTADSSGDYNPQSAGVNQYSTTYNRQYTDNSGAYNPQTRYPNRYASGIGQYVNDDSGSYYHDNGHGQYIHDNSGQYIHDNSGEYTHIHNPYEHQDQPYIHKGGEYIHPKNYVSIPPAGGYGPPVNLQRGNAAGLYDNRNYKIIRKIEHVGEDLYDYLYETENGIYAEEDGKLGNKGTKEEAIRAKGYFTYTGPDSIIYTVNYTADENGFLPDAAHIPTPPPVPEHIERSLAYQRSIGELE